MAAVVSAGVGTYCGVRALSLASAYNDPTDPSYQNQSTKSTGITLRTLSDVSFSGALVLGGVAFAQPPAKRKVIIDQDAFDGPNIDPLILVIQDPGVEVVGITVESGDGVGDGPAPVLAGDAEPVEA